MLGDREGVLNTLKLTQRPSELMEISPDSLETLFIPGKLSLSDSLPLYLSLVPIKSNFFEYYQSFVKHTCDLCKSHSKLALCLLCGEKICVRTCDPNDNEDIRGTFRLIL